MYMKTSGSGLVLRVFGLNSLLKGRSFVCKRLCSTILRSSSLIQKEQNAVVQIRTGYCSSIGGEIFKKFFLKKSKCTLMA